MKKLILILSVILFSSTVCSALEPIRLSVPDLNHGTSLMQALANRRTIREFSDKQVDHNQLSNLLWAANGINRPADGKRTAPSAMNKQDIKIYVITAEGSYLYDAQRSMLNPILAGDFRQLDAPLNLVLVADKKTGYADMDAGYVSENIYLYCAAAGLATGARGSGNFEAFARALNLTPEQHVILWHPVGYTR